MPRLTGEISAQFEVRGGLTQLVHTYHASPLKIAKTFRYDNETSNDSAQSLEQLGVYMMDCSPGLMSGDHYDINVRLEEGARVFLTNQSFTKVHPALDREGGTQHQHLQVGKDALLEYMPEPIMLYKDANLAAETEVRLAQGATLFFSDILCPGRTQRGELFQYECYVNRMKVWYEEELIFYQCQRIEPAVMTLSAPGSWESETHLGNLYIFSDRLTSTHLEALLVSLEESGEITPSIRVGASLTYKHGLVVTVMGRHAWELQALITKAWQRIRHHLLALTPLLINK
ncbi:urease accessory protein UreD [Paenibacillus roseipurpureus]|uniref:Urease accessory protein UreD n=1 Tax=Paenibacillus roseopurpureus TaxID=2918901 RepID=A0AA96LS92_9BACL|nr:urease accessory protein UreD [Paenibacillus sp. MBLB1832]WNR45611.1 urease accessory protein UreD [Paenibacillus sp. MBLB1832]